MFTHRRPGRRPATTALRLIVASTAAVALATTAACTIDKEDGSQSSASGSSADSTENAPKAPTSNVKDGATGVSVTEPVTVKGEGLSRVSLTDADGTVVDGDLDTAAGTWTSTGGLNYSTTYTLTAAAGDRTLSETFTTFAPETVTNGALAPLDGATVGVGQTIALRFDEVIHDRRAVEKLIKVTTEPSVEGAFYWVSNQEVRWRPKDHWAPGTHVTVDAALKGHDLGGGTYGEVDRHAAFTIGDEVVGKVDDANKILTFYKNGEEWRSMPVSMGKDKYPTPNGTYIVGDQVPSIVMDSSTFGLAVSAPEGYRSNIQWATQMSYSGIYIHSAPWNVGIQGVQNDSHGCLNVSPENAEWVYENVKRGDLVEVSGTLGPTLDGTDGLGDWNIPWDVWSAGNADAA